MRRRALTVIVLTGLALRLAFLIPAIGAPDRLDTGRVLAAVPAAYLLVVSASHGAYSRFRVPMTPFLAALAGAGLWRLWSLRREPAPVAAR